MPDVTPAPSLYYLRTFHAVASLLSFTRAGESLSLSQPAVSAQIRSLERYYRAPLFQVRGRRAHLTAAGQALFAYTERVFNLLREADRAVAETQGLERGHLALGASATIGIYLLPPLLGRFTTTYPAIQVGLYVGTTAETAARVLAEQVAFGLVEAPVGHADLEVQPFGEDELVLVVPPDHPWAQEDSLDGERLRNTPVLSREVGSGTRAFIETALERAGLEVQTAMVLGSAEALKQAVLAGLGVAWVPRVTARHELAVRRLVAVSVRGLELRRPLSVVRPRGLRLAPAAEAFLALVSAEDQPHLPGSPPLPHT